MTCPICNIWTPPDPESGYDADDICGQCALLGWTFDPHGNLINEHEIEPVSEMDQIRR